MIEFQELIDDIQLLENGVTDQCKLLRALANFHINSDVEDMENNRLQIIKSLKVLESNFKKLVESWQKLNSDLHSQVAYEPENDSHSELISKFVKMVVPIEMQTVWRSDSFSGSLLAFFEKGKIVSSSLIEKRLRPAHQENAGQQLIKNETNGVEKPSRVKLDEKEPFTIVKSPLDSNMNIYFTIQEPEHVIVKIYNQLDQIVHQIEKQYESPGEYTIEWDGCNDEGQRLSSDNYYCQIQIGNTLSENKTIELS